MKNLVIKVNDIIVDISPAYDKAVKKSIEFFLGKLISVEEIEDFRKKACPANNIECINRFLEENNLFLREPAIIKKFTEYYLGREFDGLINNISFLQRDSIKKLSAKYKVGLLSLMPKEHTEFFERKFKLANIISADSVSDGLEKTEKILGNDITYIGNQLTDYEACIKDNIPFIGYKIKIEGCQRIDDLKELL